MSVSDSSTSPSSVDISSAADYSQKTLKAFFDNVTLGNKKKVKKCLKNGSVAVDAVDKDSGDTALYKACVAGSEQIVDILLQFGANPNHKTNNGSTPVHAAAKSGNFKVMQLLLEGGGDLRLHDKEGLSVYDWALDNKDLKSRNAMFRHLDETRHYAKAMRKPVSAPKISTLGPISTLLRRRRHAAEPNYMMSPANSVYSMGYGKIYIRDRHQGSLASISIVPENDIKHDPHGVTYNNGPYMVMESMKWKRTSVTVKRLHQQPQAGGTVDSLISESDYMSKLRHPNLLLLMGVCPTNNLDGMVLLYERVAAGSLYHCLHEKVMSLSVVQQCEMMTQMCEALVYLHDQHLLHCCITSHAVQLTTLTDNHCCAKLSNFDHMIENQYPHNQTNVLESQQDFRSGAAHWMSPEILAGEPPNTESDMYSLMAVLWEVTHGGVPWALDTAAEIKEEVVTKGTQLKISHDSMPDTLRVLLAYGLTLNRESRRQISLLQVREICRQLSEEMCSGSQNIRASTQHEQTTADLDFLHDTEISTNGSQTLVEDSSYIAVYKQKRSRSPMEDVSPKKPFSFATTLEEDENEYADMTAATRLKEDSPSKPPRRLRSPIQENIEPFAFLKEKESIKVEPAPFFDEHQQKKIMKKTLTSETKTSDLQDDIRKTHFTEAKISYPREDLRRTFFNEINSTGSKDSNLHNVVNQLEKKILIEPTASKPLSASWRYSQSRNVNVHRKQHSKGKDSPDGDQVHSPGQSSVLSARSPRGESFTDVLIQPSKLLSPSTAADDDEETCDPIAGAKVPSGKKTGARKSSSNQAANRFSLDSTHSFGESWGPFKPASHRTSIESNSSGKLSFSGPDVFGARNNQVHMARRQFEKADSCRGQNVEEIDAGGRNPSVDRIITSGRCSPPDQPEQEWYGGGKGVKDIIQSFQNKAEQHQREQAVLQLNKQQKLYTRSVSLQPKPGWSEKQLSNMLAQEFMSTRSLSSGTVRQPPITAAQATVQAFEKHKVAEGDVSQRQWHILRRTTDIPPKYEEDEGAQAIMKKDRYMGGLDKETMKTMTVTRATETTDSLLDVAGEKRAEAEEERNVKYDFNSPFSFSAHPPKGVSDEDVDKAVDFLIQQINDGLGDVGLKTFEDFDDEGGKLQESKEVPTHKTESNTFKTEVRFHVQEPVYIPVEYEQTENPPGHVEWIVEVKDNQNSNSDFSPNQEMHLDEDDEQETNSELSDEYPNDVQEKREQAEGIHKGNDYASGEYVESDECIHKQKIQESNNNGHEREHSEKVYSKEQEIFYHTEKSAPSIVKHFTMEEVTTSCNIQTDHDHNQDDITQGEDYVDSHAHSEVSDMWKKDEEVEEGENDTSEEECLVEKNKVGLAKVDVVDARPCEDYGVSEIKKMFPMPAPDEPEEFYFDDEINADMLKDHNMRLQTTVRLGQTLLEQQQNIIVDTNTPLAHSTRCFGDSDADLRSISREEIFSEEAGQDNELTSEEAKGAFSRKTKEGLHKHDKGKDFQHTRDGIYDARESDHWSEGTYTMEETITEGSEEGVIDDGGAEYYEHDEHEEQGSYTEGSTYSPYDDKVAVREVLARRLKIRPGRQLSPIKPPRATYTGQLATTHQQHLDVIAEEGYRTSVQIHSTIDDDDDQDAVHRVTTRWVNLYTGDAEQKETTIHGPSVKSTMYLGD